MMNKSKPFFKTLVTLELLCNREDGPIMEENFEALNHIFSDCSFKIKSILPILLSEQEMINKCKEHGTDPEFFGIEEQTK